MKLGQLLLLRADQLVDGRRDYETGLWEDITKFVNPRREDITSEGHTMLKGRRRGTYSYDGSAQGALDTWADGMYGFLVGENFPWFSTELDDPMLNDVDEIRMWLQDYDQAMYAAFRRNQSFYSSLPLYFRDAGSIGTATMYTEENLLDGGAVHTCIHPREVYIDENRYGQVDTVFRKFEMSARQMVQTFDKEKLTQAIKDNAEKEPSKKHLVWHAVFPSDDKWYTSADDAKKTKKKYVSIYFLAEERNKTNAMRQDVILKQGGYDIFPYSPWRFRKNSDEIYGYSPAADAIVEIFGLNQLGKTMLQAAQRAVDGPLNVPKEMRGQVRITPQGLNYYDDPNRIVTPIYQRADYPFGVDREQRLQKMMEDKYHVEYFVMLARAEREMTAYEISERQSEKAVLMGAQVDQLYREGLMPIFNITSEIEDRAGRLPPPPPILQAYAERSKQPPRISVVLNGPLAQAQKRLFKIQPIRNAINELAPMAQIFPNVLDRVNDDEMAEMVLESAGFPQRLIRSDEEVEAIRQARAEQARQMQMQQMAEGMANAAPKLAKGADPNSPLAAIMGAA